MISHAGFLEHALLGRVTVNVRRDLRRISARWRKGAVSLNVPSGARVTEVRRALDEMVPRLMAMKPAVRYHIGQRLEFPDFAVELRRGVVRDRIVGTPRLPVSYIEVGEDIDINDEHGTRAVSDVLMGLARYWAPSLLIPHAREIALKIGKTPAGWTISTGRRTLGMCNSKGIISLSFVIMFLPAELRDYVICHELAHLSEMNHSPEFHRILNGYLGGREAELVAALKAYEWPVLRY